MIYAQDRYHWDALMVGASLAGFGLLHAGAQALLTGPVIARLGERRALIMAMAVDAVALVLVGLASHGWMALALIPLLCIGGIEQPALQALLTRQAPADRQGELQGALASLASLAGIVAPVGVAAFYAATATTLPGLTWVMAGALYLLCFPLLALWRRRAPA